MGALSPGAVLGADMIPLTLCFENLALRLLSSLSNLGKSHTN
jgi:hypothetical protein